MGAMRWEKKATISSSQVAPLKLRELTLHSIIAPKAFTLFAMLGTQHYLPHSGLFAAFEGFMLFIELGTLCGTRAFYFICHVWESSLHSETYILFITPGALRHAQGIYFMCYTRGSSTRQEHLFHMSHLKLFAVLRAFILMCRTWGSLPHSGHLFHVLRLGLFATLTTFISCTTPKALCCSQAFVSFATLGALRRTRGIYFMYRA